MVDALRNGEGHPFRERSLGFPPGKPGRPSKVRGASQAAPFRLGKGPAPPKKLDKSESKMGV